MTIEEASDFLEKCRRWFEPYTSEKKMWNEALDMAIQALKDKRAYCVMANRTCFAHGTQVAWCLTCPYISEEDRRLVVKAVEGIGKEDEHDE